MVKEGENARADAPSNPLMISEDEPKETNDVPAPSAPTIPLPVPEYPAGWDANSAKVQLVLLYVCSSMFIDLPE